MLLVTGAALRRFRLSRSPDANHLTIYLRRGEILVRQRVVNGFVSPRLGIRFDLSDPEMVVFRPDGRRFLTFEELDAEREREQQLRIAAEKRAARLAELSRKVIRQEASPEEISELERLLDEPGPAT